MLVTATAPKERQPIRAQQPQLLTDCPQMKRHRKFEKSIYNSICYRGKKVNLARQVSAHTRNRLKQSSQATSYNT